MLGPAERQFWERNGYLWLEGFIPAGEVAAIRSWTEEIAAWPDTPGRWMRYYERAPGDTPGKVLARIENFLPYHSGLDALFRSGRLAGAPSTFGPSVSSVARIRWLPTSTRSWIAYWTSRSRRPLATE